MAELKLRLNLDAEEVELVVDGQVALSSGADVFSNWVEAYNAKHPVPDEYRDKYTTLLEQHNALLEDKKVSVEEPVEEKVVETAVETPAETVDETPEA